MSRYRNGLPQLGDDLFLADGGLETTLIFHDGLELPHFAAFDLLKTQEGKATLRKYFCTYAELAKRFGAGLILESPTWRSNPDWASLLGYSAGELDEAIRAAVELLLGIRDEYATDQTPAVISGCIGPRGDGYVADRAMSAKDAQVYHAEQIASFARTEADMVCAVTMNYTEEAVGIANAARQSGMPVAVSFTVETDGKLPTGQSLGSAIEQVDAESSGYPAYYMINCAHPSHFEQQLGGGEVWLDRIRGLRANASRMSHAELDEAPELDAGNPVEFGREHAELKNRLRNLSVLGGCCGTDHRHVEQIATACLPIFRTAT